MKGSVFPGDTMVLAATVEQVETDDAGCGWVDAARDASPSTATLEDRLHGARRAARPTDDDNPWTRRGDQWRP